MASPTLLSEQGVRIAVEGCGHGTLHAIFASITKACELKGWDGIDLLIIGGDFQVMTTTNGILGTTNNIRRCAMLTT